MTAPDPPEPVGSWLRRVDLTMTERDPDAAVDLLRRVDGFAAAMRELGMVVTISGSIGLVVRPAPPADPGDVEEP